MVAEQLFTMQLLTNFLMLRSSARLGGRAEKRWRMAAAAALGAAFAVFQPSLPLLQQPGVLAVVLAVMFWLAFGSRTDALYQAAWYLTISLALCGVVVGLSRLFARQTALARGVFLYPVSFRAMVLMAGLAYLVDRMAGDRPQTTLRTVCLRLEDREIRLPALQDSGNLLRDPMTGRHVMVAEWTVARQLLPEPVQSLLCQQAFQTPAELLRQLRARCPELPAFLVPYRAVGVQSGMLLAVRCDAVSVDGAAKGRMLVAFSPTSLDESGSYRALIGGNLA